MSTKYLLSRQISLTIGDTLETASPKPGFEFGCDKCRAEPPSFMLFCIAGEDHFHVCCRNCGESVCLRDAAQIIAGGRSPLDGSQH